MVLKAHIVCVQEVQSFSVPLKFEYMYISVHGISMLEI